MRTQQQAIILSAELSTLGTSENIMRSFDLMQWLELSGFKFGQSKGCYKGTTERSYVVLVNTQDDINRLQSIAAKYNQDSILLKDANGLAHLMYGNGTEEVLGRMVGVNKSEALKQDAWTELNGQYFIVA